MDAVSTVERVAGFDPACRDRDEILAVAQDITRLRRWLDGRDAAVITALSRIASYPEKSLADATRETLRAAERSKERADLAAAAPVLGAALDAGDIGGDHLDALGRGLRRLEPAHRQTLLDDEQLLASAATMDADRFAGRVNDAVKRAQTDTGMERLERQRRNTRLRTWTDDHGMWRVSGVFDPETGMKLAARLNAAKEQLFRDAQPDTCPSDPIERDQHLAALALARLLSGEATIASGTPEFVAVIDATQPPGPRGPVVDWGIPVELPAEILRRLLGGAEVQPVVYCNGLVLHAPGVVDLGRATRLASRAQRRVLRGWYPTCAVPGCRVRFDNCKIHHIHWWRHGGPTDLHNLLPVCPHHHTQIHTQGWTVRLGPGRELRIELPDGTVLTTGPPQPGRRAA